MSLSARRLSFTAHWSVCVAAFVLASVAAAQPRSAPGAFASPEKAYAPARLLLPSTAPAHDIALSAPQTGEPNAITKSDVVRRKNQPLRVGFVRAMPDGMRRIPLESLPWQMLSDGSLVAHLRVTTKTAAGIRVGLALTGASDSIEARFTDGDAERPVFVTDASRLLRRDGFSSPVFEGESALVELHLAPGARPAGEAIISIGHLVVTGDKAKALEDVGTAGACEQDVACTGDPSQALLNAANSVAQTIVTDGGFLITCSGTLLNSIPQTGVAYFLAPRHCYDLDHVRTADQIQAVANTMSLYWFFDATGCRTNTPGPFVQTAGGATLLYDGRDLDILLFRLNAAPPAGAWYSGWDATPVLPGTYAIVLHHPQGDLKKLSVGTTAGYGPFCDEVGCKGSFIEMRYASGSTEMGSSGAPLFTCAGSSNSNCGEYRVRGGLTGGTASCAFPSGIDEYSRLDLAYPYVAQFLDPGASFSSGDNVAVEFYNVDLDHFFITATAGEQNGIANGSAGPGWFRTGHSFNTLPAGAANSQAAQVCRFYGSVVPGPNSHFYTLDPNECQFLKDLQATQPATQPRWNYEGIAFSTFVPSAAFAGECAPGTTPVFRYYNNGYPSKDSNHRFVTDATVAAFMLSQGWSQEGVGFCAPN